MIFFAGHNVGNEYYLVSSLTWEESACSIKGGRRIQHAILPNEPILFEQKIICINLIYSSLHCFLAVFSNGFVLENEPILGGKKRSGSEFLKEIVMKNLSMPAAASGDAAYNDLQFGSAENVCGNLRFDVKAFILPLVG
jgi:hypothetical protein